MASYRPKSLNELNNLYDKSMAAQNVIKNKGSAIADSEIKENKELLGSFTDIFETQEKSPSQIASDELSDALNDFMKNFGESETAAAEKPAVRQPLPITKAVKTSSSQKPKTENKAEHPVSKVDSSKNTGNDTAKVKKDKPDLMRNSERSVLLDDYMKIMNDEDDDVAFLKNIVKKKKKNKKDKHQNSPLFEEENKEESLQDNELFEEDAQQTDEYEAPQENIPEEAESEDEQFSAFYKDEEDIQQEWAEEEPQEDPAPPKKKKNVFLQILLMIILLIVLIGAVAVGLMKVVVGVDTGNAFMDKYYVFTSDEAYEDARINEGDLIITENKDFAENDVFAYADSGNGHIAYALKGTQIDDERFMAHSDNEVELIYNSSVKGTVIKTIPTVGSVVGMIMDNFIIIISALVAIALILILVLALAFRSKSSYDIDDDSNDDETENESEADYESDEPAEDENTDTYKSDEYAYADETEKSGNLFSSID